MDRQHLPGSWLSAGLLLALISGGMVDSPVQAQIVPDDTLGVDRSQVIPNVPIGGGVGDRIDGGAVRGTNLFHSFQEFNINTGQQVYFSNPVGIENIFSRVTGGNLSTIDGLLGVTGSANLFLLNPNGILFGPNARLDIQGAFMATTAERLVFAGGNEFSATNPQGAPLLSVSVPVGVQYAPGQTGILQNQGNLTTGGNLTLDGATLDLQGQLQSGGNLTLTARDTVQIRDQATQPFLANAAGQLTVQGDRIDIFALNHPSSELRSGEDLVLRSPNPIIGDAHYRSGGNFRIEQSSGGAGGLFSVQDPIILAVGDVILGDYTGASLHILAGGSVTLGNVIITDVGTVNDTINPANPDPFLASLATVPLSNGGSVAIEGDLIPTLDIRAGIDWTQLISGGLTGNQDPSGLAPIFGASPTSADITVGTVDFFTTDGGNILITNRYNPNSLAGNIQVSNLNSSGAFLGGDIIVDSRNNLNTSGITTSAFSFLVNFGSGDITLLAGGDLLTNGTLETTARFIGGDSGDITLQSGGNILVNGAMDASSADNSGTVLQGRSGNVSINAGGTLTLLPTSNIFVRGAVGGDVSLISKGDLTLQNLQIDSDSNNSDPNANLTDLTIASSQGSVLIDRATILASNNGTAVAGIISIDAANTLEVRSSRFSANGNDGLIQLGGNTSPQNLLVEDSTFSVSNANVGGSALAGVISINTIGNTTLQGSNFSALNTGSGGLGFISINTGSLLLSNTRLDVDTQGSGNAGSISIQASGNISLTQQSQISSDVLSGATGSGGDITLDAGSLSLTGDSAITNLVNSGGSGNAGSIDINVAGAMQIIGTNSRIENSVQPGALGNGGEVTIYAGSLTIAEDAKIESSTFGNGDAGNVTVRVQEGLFLRRGEIRSDVKIGARGNAGNISITADTVEISTPLSTPGSKRGRISGRVEDNSIGNSRDITINARSVLVDNGVIGFGTTGQGSSGTLTINADEMIARSDAVFNGDVGAGGNGTGGSAVFNIKGTLLFDGLTDPGVAIAPTGETTRLTTGILPGGRGQGGRVEIYAGTFLMRNGAIVKNSTLGDGDAGVTQVVADRVDISGSTPSSGLPTGLFASTAADGTAGDIDILANSFRISDGAVLSTRSQGSGQGGNILIGLSGDFEAVSGGQLLTSTSGSGQAGSITIFADNVLISGQDPTYSARLARFPNPISPLVANNITETNASSGLFANALAGASGDGGNVEIFTNSLAMANGALIQASSAGSGVAGSVEIFADDAIELTGKSRILSSVEQGGSGIGGNVGLFADRISINNGAGVTVNSDSTVDAGLAGTINLEANTLTLNQDAFVTAETDSGQGGNINLTVRDLVLLRRNSFISTTAGALGSGGDGGIININVQDGFVVAVPSENSDIIANAFGGQGGRININANRILGLQLRSRLTPEQLEQIRTNGTSDISASSDVGSDGEIVLETLNIDPSQGLVEVPVDLIDPTKLVAEGCQPGGSGTIARRRSEFVITGRGGLPPNPNDPQAGGAFPIPWVSRDPNIAGNAVPVPELRATQSPLVEAQGIAIAPDGEIRLTASTPNAAPHSAAFVAATCQAPQAE